jgi:hypothetical protein
MERNHPVAQIIELDPLVPEDITFRFRGGEYSIPGDIDVETTFRLLKLFRRAADVEESEDLDAKEKVNLEVRDALLDLFRQRDPDLAELPFGVIAFRHVLSEVLQAIGLVYVTPDEEEPGTPTKRRPKRSPPSSGSRSSSKRSTSRPKK